MIEATLVLVCKRPSPGVGKQRLAAKLGQVAALQIAEALLACALEDAMPWPGPVVIAPTGLNDTAWAYGLIASLPRSDIKILSQSEGNLGQRLNALDRTLRLQGNSQLVFVGSDAPGLNEQVYQTVRDMLQRVDIVLIPADDGGVVLMANRSPWPELSSLPWSSDRLGQALNAACLLNGQTVRMVGQGYDVDEAEDLLRLLVELPQDLRPARQALLRLVESNLDLLKAAHVAI